MTFINEGLSVQIQIWAMGRRVFLFVILKEDENVLYQFMLGVRKFGNHLFLLSCLFLFSSNFFFFFYFFLNLLNFLFLSPPLLFALIFTRFNKNFKKFFILKNQAILLFLISALFSHLWMLVPSEWHPICNGCFCTFFRSFIAFCILICLDGISNNALDKCRE